MKELERTFCVAQSTVAGIISRLEQKGFIEAFGDASDKRIKVVHITPAGEVCCREAAGYMAEVEQMLLHAAAYDYGVSFAHILLCTSFLFGVFYVLTNALQARGAATESLIVNISRQELIYIPSMFILGAIFHEIGLIWAQPVADVLFLLLAIGLYFRMSGKGND